MLQVGSNIPIHRVTIAVQNDVKYTALITGLWAVRLCPPLLKRIRSEDEDREKQARIYRADARRGGYEVARERCLVVRTQVRRLSRYRHEGSRPGSIVLA